MLDFKTGLKFARAYAKAAVMVWTDPPHDLEVKLDREDTKLENGRLTLRVIWLDRGPEDTACRSATLRVDAARLRVDTAGSDSWLLGKEHRGSAFMGVMLITAPAAALLSPVIALKNRKYGLEERLWGMSRHAVALCKAVDDGLTEEERKVLHAALRNEWRAEREHRRIVTLEEAKTILSGLHVRQNVYTDQDADAGLDLVRSLVWLDAVGEFVAEAMFYQDGGCEAHIFSTEFRDADVHALSTCWKTMEMYQDDEPIGTAVRT